MLDINSELALTVPNLISCIDPSRMTRNHQPRVLHSEVVYSLVVTKAERKYSMHFAFHNHEERFGA